jgi:hypothetical protein
MSALQEFLLKNGYKLLNENDFQSKIKDYFGISEFSKNEDVLFFNHPKGYDIDVKGQFINTYEVELYFIQEMKILEQIIKKEDNNHFICYNKIVFNDDNPSITQILHDKKAVEDLVIYFDYERNPMLLNFALNNLDVSNEEIIYLEHLIFYNNKLKEEPIKKGILLKIIDKNEDFFINLIQNLVNFWEEFSVQDAYKYKALAFLFEELLKKYHKEEQSMIDNRGYIILNNSYVKKKIILDHFDKQNYFEYKLLKNYSETYTLL